MRRPNIYAVVETGGKQYKVAPGQVLEVDHLDVAAGSNIEIDKVLLIGDGSKVTVGTPTVAGARVIATSQGDLKGEKIAVFRYKAKVRERRMTGHRQLFTRLLIDKILEPGAKEEEAPKNTRRKKKEVTEDGT